MRNLILVLVVLAVMGCEPRDHMGVDLPQPPDSGLCGQVDGGCPDCPTCSDAGVTVPDAGDITPDAGVSTPDAGCDCPDCPDAGQCQCPDAGVSIPDAACLPPPNGCDDGDACNGEEWWNQSTCSCQPGTPPVCDDDDLCTNDSCYPVDGCVYQPVVCTDDAPICLEGECVECVVDEDCPVQSDLRCRWRCEDNLCVYYAG